MWCDLSIQLIFYTQYSTKKITHDSWAWRKTVVCVNTDTSWIWKMCVSLFPHTNGRGDSRLQQNKMKGFSWSEVHTKICFLKVEWA